MSTKLNLVPAPGYILIRPLEGQKETASGIVLPESVKEKPSKGEVLAVGDSLISEAGSKVETWKDIKDGTIVVYKKWGGNEYRPQGSEEDLLFVKFEDVLGVEK